ncbi:pilus assembly protein PilP [Methylobacillus arboreus]|uniref:pilus assembly protein PilP n=1 Tax=Methylobacillus arboreus TaxID=755170 RepID=UPI001E51A26B|nr:pilus assembly protein PilP [Methylobacillus arboreus]MCB5190674.1 pilus assembly protein PilP [Methylobacillus arboreus]
MSALNIHTWRVRSGHAFVLALCLMLTACGDGQGDDLDRFIRDAGNDMHARIEPLPEVKVYTAATYNVDSTLNDPFKARKIVSSRNSLQPNMNRPREPLEAFPLESLKFVGSLSKEKLQYALILTPDNLVQQIKVGGYMGQNFGMVTEISESGATLKEIIQDELSGDWIERTSSIELQD